MPPRNIKPALHGEFYRWASSRVEGKVVLDAGCGDGAGSAALAGRAKSVIGVDLDERVIQRASATHELRNLEFRVMDCQAMSFEAASFDVVVANALFEYLPDLEGFLAGSFRVLRPGGLLLCGTKNLANSLKTADGEPLYRNHLRELTAADLEAELGSLFGQVTILSEMMTERAQAYVMNRRALGIERILVALGIKHFIPVGLRKRVRRALTGVDGDGIAERDFTIVEGALADAYYVIGSGVKVESSPAIDSATAP